MKVTKVCSHCGSGDVWVDAVSTWNEGKQRWELDHTLPFHFCSSCEGETIIIDKPIEK